MLWRNHYADRLILHRRNGRRRLSGYASISVSIKPLSVIRFIAPPWRSRWERGISEPPSHTYIEMGNTGGDPLCWYFWGRAGLSKEDLLRVTPRLQESLRKAQIPRLEIVSAGGSAKKPEDKKLQLAAIPLLRTVAASHGETGDDHVLLQDAPVESIIAAPKDWCPHPSTTSCLRVRGSSMSPLISDGYILVVDFAQNNIGELDGKVVIAWHKDKGLTVSR
jgi:hypothetical protein